MRGPCTALVRSLMICFVKTVHWECARVTQKSRDNAKQYSIWNIVHVYPLMTLNRFRRCAKQKILTLFIEGTLYITRPFTNAARSVNKSNDGMMQSEIVLFIATHARTPWTLLTRQQFVKAWHNDPKVIRKRPHEILFRVTLALGSGQKLNEQCASRSKAEGSTY